MVIDEAIINAEKRAEGLREQAEELRDIGDSMSNPKQPYNEPVKACRDLAKEQEQLAEWLKELKRLRLKNEVILRRLKHLLESKYISEFDKVDPITKEYIKDIRSADRTVMYLCNREKPCKEHCRDLGHCKHTSDILYAKNFHRVEGATDREIYEEDDEHCIANVIFNTEDLEKIVDERIIEPIKNGELVIKDERPHGKWIFGSTLGHGWMKCSNCCVSQSGQTSCWSYCPNCGADMRKEEEV